MKDLMWMIGLILGTVVVVGLVALEVFLMMLGWNYAVSPTLGVQEVNFWQMLVIQIMAVVLFQATVKRVE